MDSPLALYFWKEVFCKAISKCCNFIEIKYFVRNNHKNDITKVFRAFADLQQTIAVDQYKIV